MNRGEAVKAAKKHIVIKEHNCIFCDERLDKYELPRYQDGNVGVSEQEFKLVEEFVIKNKIDNGEEITDIMTLAYKKGLGTGRVIKAKNYVGTIVFNNGLTIEILPKIFKSKGDNEKTENEEDVKKLFIKMLRTIRNSPFKKLGFANLRTERMPLFEVFINMFLYELEVLLKKGLKSDYIKISENKNFLKGKLNIQKQLQHNLTHKERFFIEYDDYSVDRAENRIIKTALIKLLDMPKSNHTQKRIYKLLCHFDEISISHNIDIDFLKSKIDRTTKHYESVLRWCSLFLKNQGFSNFKGEEKAFAILFPMEKVFESYIAHLIRHSDSFKEYTIKTQDRKHHLTEKPKRFLLKPDIVLRRDNEKPIIIDTKWKKLNSCDKNYGISQSDIYQMYAYGKKYKAKKVILIYPKNEDFVDKDKLTFNYGDNTGYGDYNGDEKDSEGGLELIIFFVDLLGQDETGSDRTNFPDELLKLIKSTTLAPCKQHFHNHAGIMKKA